MGRTGLMPLAAAVATQLTDHSARPYELVQNGVSVLTTSVPIETIRLMEAGPGAVSTLDYDFWDPSGTGSLQDDMPVEMIDVANGVPIFRGYVDTYAPSPAFATGRTFRVSCVGVESWLDWLILPVDYTPVVGPTPLEDEIIRLVMSLNGPLRAVVGATSTAATPVAYLLNKESAPGATGGWGLGFGGLFPPATISAGTSLREALRSMISQVGWSPWPSMPSRPSGSEIPPAVSVTVDYNLGLRVWGSQWGPDGSAHAPDDYATLTVADIVGVTKATTSLSYERQSGDIYREVYVAGVDAASSGWFGDGSGIRGKQGIISDSVNITSAALAQEAADQFFRDNGVALRGTLALENVDPASVAAVRAGSLLNLTDAAIGASGYAPIASITKTFNKTANGSQNWTVAFGGLRPSAARLTRVLTRTARRWNTHW